PKALRSATTEMSASAMRVTAQFSLQSSEAVKNQPTFGVGPGVARGRGVRGLRRDGGLLAEYPQPLDGGRQPAARRPAVPFHRLGEALGDALPRLVAPPERVHRVGIARLRGAAEP